jgi:hypothetical protein
MGPLSISDLAAAGIGFEIAGAGALARGVYRSPEQISRRIAIASNSFAAFRVAEAENRSDAEVGFGCLVFGFLIQALAYAFVAEGMKSSSKVAGAGSVAILCSFACVAIGYGVGRYVPPRRTKRFLVTIACYDRWGVRHDAPHAGELSQYGVLLGYELTPEENASEEGHNAYLNRVFGIERSRLT